MSFRNRSKEALSIGMIVSSVLFCLSSSHADRVCNQNVPKNKEKTEKITEFVKQDTKAKFPPLDAIANDEKALLEAVNADAENFGRRLHNTTKAVLKQVPGAVFDALALKLGHIAIQRVFRLNEQRETDRSLISIGMMHEKGNNTTKKLIYDAYRTSINKVSYEKDIKLAVIAPDEASDGDDDKTKKYIFSKTKEQLKAFNQLAVETAIPKRSKSSPVTRREVIGMRTEEGQNAINDSWSRRRAKEEYNENRSDLSEKGRAEARSHSEERAATAKAKAEEEMRAVARANEQYKIAIEKNISQPVVPKNVGQERRHLKGTNHNLW